MQDTIILGNGNSKQIKTASLPNSYAEFKAMAENGNLFADIRLNADGCEVVGTPLNKLNLLTDETATKWNNANNVDEALSTAFDIVKNLPIVFESEIIFEGRTGDFTKPFENFDAISVLTNPTDDRTNYSYPNAMMPTRQLLDRLSIVNQVTFKILTNTIIDIAMTKTAITSASNTYIRVYGHKIKAVIE